MIRSDEPTDADASLATFAIDEASTMALDSVDGVYQGVRDGQISLRGAIMFAAGDRRATAGDLSLEVVPGGRWVVYSNLARNDGSYVAFELSNVLISRVTAESPFRLMADLEVSNVLASRLGDPNASGTVFGTLMIEANVRGVADSTVQEEISVSPSVRGEAGTAAQAAGPDVIVGTLYGPISYGSSGGISAFAIGTTSCNAGDAELSWISGTNEHPVIAQNMFRLKEGRFEQIGQAWLKHGFFALQGNECGIGCTPSGAGGAALGVGCSDPYSASLNGSQFSLGPKSEVDAYTGNFPYPPGLSPGIAPVIGRRLQVHNVDLDPSLNPGALYFVEGQYVTPDDAAAGNHKNNASYIAVSVSGGGSSFSISTAGTTQRENPAILAWKAVDPSVTMSDVTVPDEGGLMYVGSKATDLGGGVWHYEYAVQNLNSHRSGRAFSVPIDSGMTITNIGFHDVDYHSGEPYSLTDWGVAVSADAITWSTEDFATDVDANALRWGTLYNFRFDADRAPINSGDVTIGFFRPGDTMSTQVRIARAPELSLVDCSGCVEAAAPQAGPGAVPKSRFVSFSYTAADCPTAMRITLADLPEPYDVFNGQTMWLDAPELRCENSGQAIPPPGGCGPAPGLPSRTFAVSGLRCDGPVYSQDWSLYNEVHVHGNVIVPMGNYEIQAIAENCDVNIASLYSPPLSVSNGVWGDVTDGCGDGACGPPDGTVGVVTDAIAMVSKFSNGLGAPSSAIADLVPDHPDFLVDIQDIVKCLEAFSGLPYPYPIPADPCSQ